jgi:uncharacterized protein YraI
MFPVVLNLLEVAMKFSGRVSFIVAVGLVLVGLTSCRGASLGNLVDDAGRVIKSGVDEIPPPRNPDIPPIPGTLDDQAPQVVKVEPLSEKVVNAVIEQARDQLIEVSIDCVTGEIKPSGAVDPSYQGNIVESACQRFSQNGDAATSQKRVVQAGEGYANLRSAASTEKSTVAEIPNGTEVEIIEQTRNSSGQLWYKVRVNGQEGWMFSGLLD